jgi:tRNA pseudouridine55 synthase
MLPPSGILNLAKPSGISSRRALDVVARLVRPTRAGHAGTLDPLADGVLVVCVGQATRLIEYVQRMSKTYEATFLLGRTSDTEDVEGHVVESVNPPVPSCEQIVEAAKPFVGEILQRPPAFSALKVQGRRAYDLARSGETVELTPRPITVYEIEVMDYDYPTLRLRIACGSGTYVRSLGRDLAESLGTGVVMSALTRTAIGPFTLADACTPESLLSTEDVSNRLHPPNIAVGGLPSIAVDETEIRTLRFGQQIVRSDAPIPSSLPTGELVAYAATGKLVALLKPAGGERWAPSRNFD